MSETDNKSMTENFIEEALLYEEKQKNENINENNVIEPKENGDEEKTITDTLENEKAPEEEPEPEWQDILGSGVIMKKILNKGKSDTRPHRGQKCTINYVCKLEDDTIVENVQNAVIYLGECDVVQGLDVSIGLMDINEKCLLKIQPRLAYGAKGLPPQITANTTIVYDIELLAIDSEDEIESLSIQQRKITGNKKRERGNWWYQRGENNLAIQCYRRALDYLDEVEGGISGPLSESGQKEEVTDADLQNLLDDRISVCNNMAAAQIKMELYDAALLSLQTVLRCQPDNVKALFRKAKVHVAKNDLATALKCLEKAKELDHNDATIQKEINLVNKMMLKQKNSEKEYARRMFCGTAAKTENSKSRMKKETKNSKLNIWATIVATFVVGIAGAVAYKFRSA